MASSWFQPLLEGCSSACRYAARLAVGVRGPIAKLRVQEIEQRRGTALVRIYTDIAVPLRHIKIAGSKVSSDAVAIRHRFMRPIFCASPIESISRR
jgi:hypothetical protein